MRRYWVYLRYIIRHKWFVFLECCKFGIPLLGIVHDLSKLLPAEFFPYARSFYNPDGSRRDLRDEVGHFDPTKISEEFDRAWLHHIHWNKHHWQYWLLVQDEDEDKILSIPYKYRCEMLADWFGAGRALGTPDTKAWYLKSKEKLQLHPDTRGWIEYMLEIE